MDRAAKHVPQNIAVAQRELRELLAAGTLEPAAGPAVFSADHVEKVLFILSAPRSGSSFLFHVLTHAFPLYSLGGEENPLYRIFLDHWDRVTDDRLDRLDVGGLRNNSLFWQAFRRCLGTYSGGAELNRFALAARLCWQWPFHYLDFDFVAAHLLSPADLLESFRRHAGLTPGVFYRAYDTEVAHSQSERHFLADQHELFEEPPYVWPHGFMAVDDDFVAANSLVLKTSTNSYKIGKIMALFPNAQFKFVYLKRHAFPAINGLIDGWRHHGFHSYNTDHLNGRRLHIKYLETEPDNWWKFDLFPGWESYADSAIEDICAAQWAINNDYILAFLSRNSVDCFELRYEDLLDRATFADTMESLQQWLGVPAVADPMQFKEQKVMYTSTEGVDRWKRRDDVIRAAFGRSDRAKPVLTAMGYLEQTHLEKTYLVTT